MLGKFFKKIISIAQAYSEKYTDDISHNLHTFVHVLITSLLIHRNVWGIELFTPNKTYKIFENNLYFKTTYHREYYYVLSLDNFITFIS